MLVRRAAKRLLLRGLGVILTLFLLILAYGPTRHFVLAKVYPLAERLPLHLGVIFSEKEKLTRTEVSHRTTKGKGEVKAVVAGTSGVTAYNKGVAYPEPQTVTSQQESYTTVDLGGGKKKVYPVPRCEKSKYPQWYVVKAEYVGGSVMMPLTAGGAKTTQPILENPVTGKRAAIRQDPEVGSSAVSSTSEILEKERKGIEERGEEYARGLTPAKNTSLGAINNKNLAVRRVPGDDSIFPESKGIIPTVPEFEMPLYVNTATAAQKSRCGVGQAPGIVLTAPDEALAKKLANAYNLPLAVAKSSIGGAMVYRLPGHGAEKFETAWSGKSDDEKIVRYLLVSLGFDISDQTYNKPEDAGVVFKIFAKLKKLVKKDKPLGLVAKKNYDYTYVPVKCTCEGSAKVIDWKKLKVVDVSDKWGNKIVCRAQIGYARLGTPDIPVSADSYDTAFNTSFSGTNNAMYNLPGNLVFSSKLSVVELAYVMGRLVPEHGTPDEFMNKVFYGKFNQPQYRSRVPVERIKETRDIMCGASIGYADIMARLPYYYVQQASLKLEPVNSCKAPVTGGVSLKVLSFLDPRGSQNYKQMAAELPTDVASKDLGPNAPIVRLLIDSAVNYSYYNWRPVIFVLKVKDEGSRIKMELKQADPSVLLKSCAPTSGASWSAKAGNYRIDNYRNATLPKFKVDRL